MDKVTLDYRGYLLFTGWSERHCAKQTQNDRKAKLVSMGVHVVTTAGRGKKASYEIEIPSEFWSMLLIPTVKYSDIGAAYIDILVEGKDKLHMGDVAIVRFATEIYEELAEDYEAKLEAVKATCKRVRAYLIEYDYIQTDQPHSDKTHRIKQQKDDDWAVGQVAIEYDERARSIWYNFFQEKLSLYQEINATATAVPLHIIGKELRELYSFGMKEQLGVAYYRVARKTHISGELTSDIAFVRHLFLETLNLTLVKEELAGRQASHKIKKELNKKALELTEDKEKLSKEDIEAERQAMKVVSLRRETQWRPPTEEQKERIMRAVELAVPVDEDD